MQKGAADKGSGRESDQAKENFMQQIVLDGEGKNTHQGYEAD